jgi:molybdate transport system ATP-binding protein
MLAAELKGRVGTTDVSIQLDPLKTLLVIGPNGAGKSSMMRMLLGVLRPQAGRVLLNGRCLFDSSSGICVPPERRRIGFMPQSYALFPQMTALDNVAFGLECLGLNRTQRRARAGELLEELGVSALAERLPAQLSGGEAQRIALARALAPRPEALLLDEPMAALDLTTRAQVRSFLCPYLAACALPTIVISHDPEDAVLLGHSIAVIEGGSVVQRGSIDELRAQPATQFVRTFVACGSLPPPSLLPKAVDDLGQSSWPLSLRPSFVGGLGI